jgi:predicted nucleic acid-binding protein
MVIMKGLDIKLILTGDEHFEQAGMGFQKVP